jgi:hypothetical protein
MGLLAAVWERRPGDPAPLRGSHVSGVLLYCVVCGGWFLLAYWDSGQDLVDKMLGKELAGHAISGKGTIPGLLFYQQPLYYLGRSAPWSLLAYYGLWRLWRRPASDVEERVFERFLYCWFRRVAVVQPCSASAGGLAVADPSGGSIDRRP